MAASVAQHQATAVPPATSMMSRVDRLDLVLGYLEEMMMQQQQHGHRTSTAAAGGTWSPSSTASSSSFASTPRAGSKTWRRRPAKEALEEAQAKGTLVDRIAVLEDRVLKMEEDITITPEKMNTMSAATSSRSSKKTKSIKSLVKSCVRGKLNTKE